MNKAISKVKKNCVRKESIKGIAIKILVMPTIVPYVK